MASQDSSPHQVVEPAESWEQLKDLSLNDKEGPTAPPPPPAQGNTAGSQSALSDNAAAPAGVDGGDLEVDPAIRQALQDPRERGTVLRCEELVEAFLADSSKDVLEFPATLTNYQRMLAHRVAQHFGLQTSTADYENGHGRVVGYRTKFIKTPKVKLADLEVNMSAPRMPGDRPKLLKRPNDPTGTHKPAHPGAQQRQQQPQNLKDREEDYHKARERIIGADALAAGAGRGRGNVMGGRGMVNNGPAAAPGANGGRGKKALFRDRDKELNDPDYRRGAGRYAPTGAFDPSYMAQSQVGGIYNVPTYQSEFPTLASGTPSSNSANSSKPYGQGSYSQGYGQQATTGYNPRGPPPPPPPQPGATQQGASKGTYQGSTGGAPGPMMSPMARPQYAMPMTPYPMAGMPMAYPAMPGAAQGPMYAAPFGFPGMAMAPGTAYGFMAPASQEGMMAPAGAFPMYGYPMQAGPMQAYQMQPGPGGRMMAVPMYGVAYQQPAQDQHAAAQQYSSGGEYGMQARNSRTGNSSSGAAAEQRGEKSSGEYDNRDE